MDVTTNWLEVQHQLKGFIAKRVNNDAVADDLLQDVFLKMQGNIHSLKDENKMLPWMFQITRNIVNDHHRQLKRQQKSPVPLSKHSEDDDHNYTRQFAYCIRPMIMMLPEIYRDALLLSEIEGVSQKELAERLGISYSGAKSRVQRGRQMLKEQLLQCCEIKTDAYGNVVDYHKRK